MGQTLTHGIYLPDEGERNCYNGLAANWQLLDGAVGTVAEHTSALAGKAPLVHTHTVSQITDFPAYGNAAGTICEGNDSRLSDARTPVAHTHSKSDVTDLFNSANAWTGENIFNNDLLIKNANATQGTTPSSNKTWTLTFCDSNKATTGQLYCQYRTNGSIYLPLRINNGTYDYRLNFILYAAGNAVFSPSVSGIIDLGSSSYQWNNLYAKNYYYNGTEFQSKFATLDTDQTITGVKTLTNYWHLQAKNLKAGEGETYGRTGYSFSFTDKNDVAMGDITLFKNSQAARTLIRVRGGDYYTNSAPAAAGTLVQSAIMIGTNVTGTKIIEADTDIFYPTTTGVTDLGTSTNKWKTLNGVNPGALSLPNIEASTNLAGDITDFTGATQLSLNSSSIGWVYIQIPNVQGDYIEVQIGNSASIRYFVSAGYSDSLDSIEVLVPKPPVVTKVRVKATGGAVSKALFYPCLGNV